MSDSLIVDWERICGLTPADTLQQRRDTVISKIQEKGGLSRAHFISIAQTLGFTIEIEELLPFMAGWGRAGDSLYVEESIFIWMVKVDALHVYYFRAGQSWAGEILGSQLSQLVLENLFNNLKPAHTYVYFTYN